MYIISGRDSAFLEQHLGHLKNVGFSAEHGGFFRERGVVEWTNLTKSLDMSWMGEVEEIFRYYTEVCCLFTFFVFSNFRPFFLKKRVGLIFYFRGRREVILK